MLMMMDMPIYGHAVMSDIWTCCDVRPDGLMMSGLMMSAEPDPYPYPYRLVLRGLYI